MAKKKTTKPDWNPTWGKMETEMNELLRDVHESNDWRLANKAKRTMSRFKALRDKMEK